jgi:hypothetical protein
MIYKISFREGVWRGEALERLNSRSDIKDLKQQGDADMYANGFNGEAKRHAFSGSKGKDGQYSL